MQDEAKYLASLCGPDDIQSQQATAKLERAAKQLAESAGRLENAAKALGAYVGYSATLSQSSREWPAQAEIVRPTPLPNTETWPDQSNPEAA